MPEGDAAASAPLAENKRLTERLFEELWQAGRLAAADELLTPDYTGNAPDDRAISGAEGLKRMVNDYRSGFPDLDVTVDHQIAEGDRVVTEFSMKGTHSGTWAGVRATGREISLGGCVFSHVAGGRITEQWYEWDRRKILEQVGIMPSV